MFNYVWPIALIVTSNVVYHICAKSTPEKLDPFASLTVTYFIGAFAALIFYFVFNKGGNIAAEYRKLNWAPFILGLAVVGLEVGVISAYKNGWQVSRVSIVQASVLAVLLIIVGAVLFKEQVTWNKIIGIAICLAGLVIINLN